MTSVLEFGHACAVQVTRRDTHRTQTAPEDAHQAATTACGRTSTHPRLTDVASTTMTGSRRSCRADRLQDEIRDQPLAAREDGGLRPFWARSPSVREAAERRLAGVPCQTSTSTSTPVRRTVGRRHFGGTGRPSTAMVRRFQSEPSQTDHNGCPSQRAFALAGMRRNDIRVSPTPAGIALSQSCAIGIAADSTRWRHADAGIPSRCPRANAARLRAATVSWAANGKRRFATISNPLALSRSAYHVGRRSQCDGRS
jgi:hypothetical protein